MFVWKTIKYQLYLLQLENYELARYFKLLYKKGFWPKGEQRKELVWTAKAWVLLGLAVLLHVGLGFLLVSNKSYVLGVLVFCLLFTIYCLLFSLAVVLLWPADWIAKYVILAKARIKIKKLKDLKVIGIAGSYGKTTMKEVLFQVLSSKYQVASTPESVNTEIGVARWILKNVDSSTEIIVVEMGEHYKGDVEAICNISKPDVAVVTGINEAHLERMKTLENITETVFEVVSQAKPGALVLLNGDDANVTAHYKEYVWPDHKVEKFQTSNFKFQKFDQENLVWIGQIDPAGEVAIKLLGEYALGDVDAAIKIALSLGMNAEEIKRGIANIRPVEHRLQPIRSAGGILVIDDAYNGNPAGALTAIRTLSRFEGRRKVYVTPGLVEMGKSSKDVHLEIGRQLAGAADVVILIKNSVTKDIESGITNYESGERQKPQIIWFETAQEAHTALPGILKTDDVVLFQNDWGDQYV